MKEVESAKKTVESARKVVETAQKAIESAKKAKAEPEPSTSKKADKKAEKEKLNGAAKADFYILNGRTLSDPHGSFTFHHHVGASLIEYALVSPDLFFRDELDLAVLPTDFTDHSVVSIILPLACPQPPDPQGQTTPLLPKIELKSDNDKNQVDERFARYSNTFFIRANHALSERMPVEAVTAVTELIRLLSTGCEKTKV